MPKYFNFECEPCNILYEDVDVNKLADEKIFNCYECKYQTKRLFAAPKMMGRQKPGSGWRRS